MLRELKCILSNRKFKTSCYQIVLIALYLTSCQKINKDKGAEIVSSASLENFKLSLIDTLEVKIADSVNNSGPIYHSRIFDRLGFYTIQHFDTHTKLFYSDTDTLFSVKYDLEGPNGIGKISKNALILSEDSIYMTNKAFEVLRVDLKGNLLEKHQLQLGDSIMDISSSWTLPLLKVDDKLLINIMPAYRTSSREFQRMPLDGFFSLNEKAFILNENRYPFHYEKGYYGLNSYSYGRVLTNNHEVVYSFIYDPNFYVEFTESELSEFAGSERIDEKAPFDELYKFLLRNEQHFHLVYDDKNDLVIRLRLEGINEDQINTAKWWNKAITAMLFKENQVGSYQFKPSLYSREGIFCEEGILYMPFHNKSNPDAVENQYVYHLFEISF